ncbi:MAG: hypothetical protein HQL31_12345 [Planctomycetes bacterium]|nr:hypothetical protein [Planctomycetota bacterium]
MASTYSVASTAAVLNADGTYTVTFTSMVPANAMGTAVVNMEGRPKAKLLDSDSSESNIPVKNEQFYFAITGTTSARREVVELDKCLDCHGHLSLHGSNRSNSIDACVTCHNPDATDYGKRTSLAGNTGVDGKYMESIDFKVMIHAIHAAEMRENAVVVHGYSGNPTYFRTSEVHFPGSLKNCEICHTKHTSSTSLGSYELPLSANVRATTGNVMSNETYAYDDLKTTPIAAVCSSCHDSAESAQHMKLNGALFDATLATIYAAGKTETCAICHGDEKSESVRTAHGIE